MPVPGQEQLLSLCLGCQDQEQPSWASVGENPPFSGAFAPLVLGQTPREAEPQCSLCPCASVSPPAPDRVYLAKVSAGDRLGSAGPHPEGKLRKKEQQAQRPPWRSGVTLDPW